MFLLRRLTTKGSHRTPEQLATRRFREFDNCVWRELPVEVHRTGSSLFSLTAGFPIAVQSSLPNDKRIRCVAGFVRTPPAAESLTFPRYERPRHSRQRL